MLFRSAFSSIFFSSTQSKLPKKLPLAKAYALLSLSYILVWAAAIWLPGWHEPFHWQSLLGVLLIVAGVLTIFWPVKRQG